MPPLDPFKFATDHLGLSSLVGIQLSVFARERDRSMILGNRPHSDPPPLPRETA